MTLSLFDPLTKLGHTLTNEDVPRLMNATQRVLASMMSGDWHTVEQLRTLGGLSGDRRARQLRALGLPLEVERVKGGLFRYRLALTTADHWQAAQAALPLPLR